MCTFDDHETMVYCEICGVFWESFVKSAKDGLIKGSINGVSSDSGTHTVSSSHCSVRQTFVVIPRKSMLAHPKDLDIHMLSLRY
ncbi:hypothetical protein BRADI_1g78716v3 [Brachypodium distachyon]|uniref:Uncharacterized protein n=1 Tax=Brachypodium distachyon TaxID=15368 RepID=A0A0Q3LLN6_BRADI|nr:hypothetical protein BRADI_1g78716v3 [Brachypodium distachyon]PNT78403.1 hypothetical protein BRADI_1g78716v3 [Brachypodium distachyon]